MVKQNRALKVIDKNSLPKIIDILEVPKAKETKPTNEPLKSRISSENVGSMPVRPRKRRRKPLASSKTPKMSNLGGYKNVTTRRSQAKNSRPPIPNSISSTRKKRKGFGSSILTPYGAQMAKLKNRSTINSSLTPSQNKSPNLLKHYDRLKPIARSLNIQHSRSPLQLERAGDLPGNSEGRKGLHQKTTINSTPSTTCTPSATTRKLSIVPSQKRGVKSKTIQEENIEKCENNDHIETKDENSHDDMDCGSSDGLSLNSSSSSSSSSSFSSPPKQSKQFSSGSPSDWKGPRPSSCKKGLPVSDKVEKSQLVEKIDHSQSSAKLLSDLDDAGKGDSQTSALHSNKTTDRTDIDITDGTQRDPDSATIATTAIENVKVFNLVMGNHSSVMENELLGSTIGDGQFFRNTIDEDSVLTAFTSVDDQNSEIFLSKGEVDRVLLRTPVYVLQNPELSPSLSKEQKKNQRNFFPQNHDKPIERLEEESIEAWSIDGHSSSPFFFDIGGKKYGHPALPPGWTMRISRGENRPVYSHPDHGRTWHCPIKLTPNMVYVKNIDGKYVKQIRNSVLNPSKKDLTSPKRAHGGSQTPQTPPSLRGVLPFENENRHQASQAKRIIDVDHFELQHEDQDSTSELIREISTLSAGLVEKSSSNLQKVEKVKTIHQNTSDLPKELFSADKKVVGNQQSEQLLPPRDLEPQVLSSTTSLSTSSQAPENETPSTMSAVLRQYERTLGRCNNVTTYSEPQYDKSRRQSLLNGNVSTNITSGGVTNRLSPIVESTVRCNARDTVNSKDSDVDMTYNSSTRKKMGSNKSNQRFPSDSSRHQFKSSSFFGEAMADSEIRIADRKRGNTPSNVDSFIASSHASEKSTPNTPRLQKSKNTEPIEAWFTPAIDDTTCEEVAVLRFSTKEKGRRPRLYEKDNNPNNEVQAQTNIELPPDSKTLKDIRIRAKHPFIDDEWSPLAQSQATGDKDHQLQQQKHESTPNSPIRNDYKPIGKENPDMSALKGDRTVAQLPTIQYDEEWSPLAQPYVVGDKYCPRQRQGKYEGTPESPLRHDFKPNGCTKVDENPITATTSRKEVKSSCNADFNQFDGTPKQSLCNGRSPSNDETCIGLDQIISGRKSTLKTEVKNAKGTILTVQETKDVLKPKEKNGATSGSNNKSEACFDTRSSNTDSTKSDLVASDHGEKRAQKSTKNNDLSSVTISVHAHGPQKKSTDTFHTGPLEEKRQSSDSQSSATIGVSSCSESSVQGDDSHFSVLRENSKTRLDAETKSVPRPGIKSREDEETDLSGESFHPLKADSTNGDCDNSTTNGSNGKTENTTKSQTESEDEQTILEISLSRELGTWKDIEFTRGESTTDKQENSEGSSTHKLNIYDESTSCNGSFTFADDFSETFQDTCSSEHSKRNVSQVRNSNARRKDYRPSSATSFSPLKKNFSSCIEGALAGSEAGSPIESPVKPTALEKCDSFNFPRIESSRSSIESKAETSTFELRGNSDSDLKLTSFVPRKQNRMSWRVLNPPHPICSLQRLEELMALKQKGQKFRAKRPKRGGQRKTKKHSAGRRRKPKRVRPS